MVFYRIALNYHRFTLFTFGCMFLWVINFYKLFVTKRALLSVGVKIQDDCQSWPLIAAKVLFVLQDPIMKKIHYSDVIIGAIASQITSLTIVYSTVYSDADQRKHQSSGSLAFHREPENSPYKWPVTRKYFHLMTSSWYGHKQCKTKFFTLGWVFITNGNVDNEHWWCMPQGPFVNCHF